MKLLFSERAWDDYLHWQAQDEKIHERLNILIREASRTPFSGDWQTGTLARQPVRLVVKTDHPGASAGVSGAGWGGGDCAVQVSLLNGVQNLYSLSSAGVPENCQVHCLAHSYRLAN